MADLHVQRAAPAGRSGVFARRVMLVLVCLAAQAQNRTAVRLYPVDETSRDPAFRSFTGKLRSAVAARNVKALRKLVDDDVVSGPGADDTGWEKFAARWHPDESDSDLWPALSDLLSLGFVREHPRLFVSPYLVWRFPRDLDMSTHMVVVRDDAPLRAAPSVKAPVEAELSFDIVVKLGAPDTGQALIHWLRVRTLDGRTGYMNGRDLMSPLMPRAQFGFEMGRWRLVALERP
ncbi:MAG: SH3 domain-containing protein [Bryobacterales bacterium]|nr:SH3 domain-containing protein [Bryobacterales bacterium]